MYRSTLYIVYLLIAAGNAYGQRSTDKDTLRFHINSLRESSFSKYDKPKPDPQLNERMRRGDGQLMYWPFYPLTAQQMETRPTDDLSVPQYIISEVITSYLNFRRNNRKPTGTIPKF